MADERNYGSGAASRSKSSTSVNSVDAALNATFNNIKQNVANPYNAGYNAALALSNVDLSSPTSYMTSGADLAEYNTLQSQALAREQMAFQEKANAKAMDFSASEALKNRNWQEMMSNTAHQREVADLIKAGLNPVLSANNGATTPSGASASGVTSSGAMGNVDTSAVTALTNAYTQAKNIEMQEKALNIQNKQIEAQMIMNALTNSTNEYMANKSAYASMYNSGVMSSANRYAAGVSAAAARYAADVNKSIYEDGLHGTDSVAGKLIDDFFTGVFSNKPKNTRSLKEWIFGVPSSAKVMENPNYKSLGDSIGDFLKGLIPTSYEAVRR